MVRSPTVGFVEECLIALAPRQRAAAERVLAPLHASLVSQRPDVDLDAPALARFLVDRLPADARTASGFEKLRLSELCLAWACLDGQPKALAAFEREVMPHVRKAIRGVDASAQVVNEVANATRTRLLVAEGARRPGLERYAGTGPLASFAMVVAMRLAVDAHRQPKPAQTLEDVLAEACDPQLRADEALGREALGPVVQRALAEATAALTPRERTLLKLHVVQGVSAEKLGQMYRVHRATSTRWLTEARQKVLTQMTAVLRRELKVGAGTFAQLTSELLGGLDLTLSGVFSGAEEAPGSLSR